MNKRTDDFQEFHLAINVHCVQVCIYVCVSRRLLQHFNLLIECFPVVQFHVELPSDSQLLRYPMVLLVSVVRHLENGK